LKLDTPNLAHMLALRHPGVAETLSSKGHVTRRWVDNWASSLLCVCFTR